MYQKEEFLVIKKFTGIRHKGTGFELRVKWRGFHDIESHWTTLVTLQQGVPTMVEEYLRELKQSGTAREHKLAPPI